MELEIVNINDLISPDYNPRRITEKEKEKLKQSITEFDYIEPIIVNRVNNHIIGGNQRYSVLKELGYEEIEVVYIDEEDPNREKALNIALNKISGDWDTMKLEDILNELNFDSLNLTGFDEYELELFRNDDLDVSDLLGNEGEEYELPDDYMDVTGHDANKSYLLTIGFPSQDDVNKLLEYLECPKRMTRDTIQLMYTDIDWEKLGYNI